MGLFAIFWQFGRIMNCSVPRKELFRAQREKETSPWSRCELKTLVNCTNAASMCYLCLVQGQSNTTLLHASPSERRQLSIAIALIGDPKVSVNYVGLILTHWKSVLFSCIQIIVLDEPTANVDPFAKRVVWEHVEKLKRERSTVLVTTHSMDEAEILSDRCVSKIDIYEYR